MSKILALLVLVIVVVSFLRSRKEGNSEQSKALSKEQKKESPKVINPDEQQQPKQITDKSSAKDDK